ncbi:hypothetical protein BAE44_0021962 [Dichanthelium oligosanthes]|uniref:DUF7595 domain-containing protein n=1 Tax=Dichanthelium oligosanthes TaxID=888268 RepID=A0A1E5UW11_9POAL|nr:hypothetical protein BAE44_0021962 [Dichanthelium oligosanthes]
MPGGGGGDVARPRAPGRGRLQRQPQHQTPSLPLDVVLAIAARTDAATLVRCAATCADARARLADNPNLRARLRLRHTDRFVPPLLRGDLVHTHVGFYTDRKSELYLLDTAVTRDAAATCRLRRVTTGGFPLASRDGLLLLRMDKNLRVCDPATGRSQTVPLPESLPVAVQHNGKYVLLVGDGEDGGAGAITGTGRPFQVLLACLELSQHRRYLRIQIFSSDHAAWSRATDIRTPNLQGSRLKRGLGRALVVGGAVHWLCLTDTGAYALKLHVRAAQVTVTTLPESVPQSHNWWHEPLLATSSAGGSPVVLFADGGKVLAWAQSKQTAKWKPQPQVVVETEAMLRFLDSAGGTKPSVWTTSELDLVWFAERSGAVLIRMSHDHFFWLDLQSMEIVRWFSDRRIMYGAQHCPYEMNLSDWVPTFSSSTL